MFLPSRTYCLMILSFALTDQDISVFIMLRIILHNPIVLALNILLLSGQLRKTHCESGRFVLLTWGYCKGVKSCLYTFWIKRIFQQFDKNSFVFHSITLSFRKQGEHFHSNGINQFPMQAHTLYTACLIYLSYWIACSSDEVRISSCSCNAFQFRPTIIALHFR